MRAIRFCLIFTLLNFTLQISLKILETPDGTQHPEHCSLVCSGISRYNEPDTDFLWRQNENGKVYKKVEISDCGFASPPILTATTQGGSTSCPSLRVFEPRNGSLRYVWVASVEDLTVDNVTMGHCDVYWIATGYNC